MVKWTPTEYTQDIRFAKVETITPQVYELLKEDKFFDADERNDCDD